MNGRAAYDPYRTLTEADANALRRKVLRSPAAARAFLRKVGVIDRQGKLTEAYGGQAPARP